MNPHHPPISPPSPERAAPPRAQQALTALHSSYAQSRKAGSTAPPPGAQRIGASPAASARRVRRWHARRSALPSDTRAAATSASAALAPACDLNVCGRACVCGRGGAVDKGRRRRINDYGAARLCVCLHTSERADARARSPHHPGAQQKVRDAAHEPHSRARSAKVRRGGAPARGRRRRAAPIARAPASRHHRSAQRGRRRQTRPA